ncbi:MAG: hypothetical protein K5857_04880 [Lachnospiraceae bacterium]|nr:hypothetical protein [Lachnospiraceae bacterium]
MINEKVYNCLKSHGYEGRITVHKDTIDTVEHAAMQIGCTAGGDEFTSVSLAPDELETASDAVGWCDVCKGWDE